MMHHDASAWFWPYNGQDFVFDFAQIRYFLPRTNAAYDVFSFLKFRMLKTPMLHVDWPAIFCFILFFDVVRTFILIPIFSTKSIVNVVSRIIIWLIKQLSFATWCQNIFSQVWPIRSRHWGSNKIEGLRLINTLWSDFSEILEQFYSKFSFSFINTVIFWKKQNKRHSRGIQNSSLT